MPLDDRVSVRDGGGVDEHGSHSSHHGLVERGPAVERTAHSGPRGHRVRRQRVRAIDHVPVDVGDLDQRAFGRETIDDGWVGEIEQRALFVCGIRALDKTGQLRRSSTQAVLRVGPQKVRKQRVEDQRERHQDHGQEPRVPDGQPRPDAHAILRPSGRIRPRESSG